MMQFIFQSSHPISGNTGCQKPWSFGLFVHWHNPDFGVAGGKMSFQSHDSDTAQTLSPEAALRCNDYSINYSSAPAFHMRPLPPSFSRDDKPGDKELQKCQKLRHPFFRNCVTLLQNCIIHHISVKNVLFIQHHMTRIGLMRNSST